MAEGCTRGNRDAGAGVDGTCAAESEGADVDGGRAGVGVRGGQGEGSRAGFGETAAGDCGDGGSGCGRTDGGTGGAAVAAHEGDGRSGGVARAFAGDGDARDRAGRRIEVRDCGGTRAATT